MMVDIQMIAFAVMTLGRLSPVQAAVFNVAAGDVAGLISAINTANGNNEDDTINLAAGTYTLTAVNNDTDGSNGLPSITTALTIHGAGANHMVLARAASAPAFRIAHVAATGIVTLEGLTATGAFFPLNNFALGGGIFNAGTLTLLRSIVNGNSLDDSADAGGIYNTGTLTLLETTVSGNSGFRGGGILNFGTLTVLNSTISGNSGLDAGGIANLEGTVNLLNSTITDNRTDEPHAVPHIGGIQNEGGTITLNQSIISGNGTFAPIGPDGEEVLLRGFECENAEFGTPLGQIISLGHNLVGASGGCPSDGPGDLTVDPAKVFITVLGPLQNNGGPTLTHALVPGSPAIDAGNITCTDASGNPLTTDQRGKPRPVDGNGDGLAACDIGAFEFFPTVNELVEVRDLHTKFSPKPVEGGPEGTFTITRAFTNTSGTPLRFLFFGVSQLTQGSLLLNADGGPGGVGATLTPEITGDVLAPGAEVTGTFVIGLQQKIKRKQLTFFVNVFAEPLQ
jgi:hypothetical protein